MNGKILANQDELSTKSKILLAAKAEFLQKGFDAANVRTIAKKAGLTTGAIYNLFKNKDGIFDELIGSTFAEFAALLSHDDDDYKRCNMKTMKLKDIIEISRSRFTKIIDFFYENWDAMKLIICCSKGSSYEYGMDGIIENAEKETIWWLKHDNIAVSKRAKFFIHVMVSSYFENLKEVFEHDLKKNEALQYMDDINCYHCAGWQQYWLMQEE